MAVWIKFISSTNTENYINLDETALVRVDTNSQSINLYAGGQGFDISFKESPEGYQQILNYLANQIEQS